ATAKAVIATAVAAKAAIGLGRIRCALSPVATMILRERFDRSLDRLQVLGTYRQAPDALSRPGEDGVGHRWSDRRHAGLTDTAHLLRAGHDVHLHGRHLVHAQHRIVVKVPLLDSSALERDLAVKRSREAEDDAAFHLGPDAVRIHDRAAIDR